MLANICCLPPFSIVLFKPEDPELQWELTLGGTAEATELLARCTLPFRSGLAPVTHV